MEVEYWKWQNLEIICMNTKCQKKKKQIIIYNRQTDYLMVKKRDRKRVVACKAILRKA